MLEHLDSFVRLEYIERNLTDYDLDIPSSVGVKKMTTKQLEKREEELRNINDVKESFDMFGDEYVKEEIVDNLAILSILENSVKSTQIKDNSSRKQLLKKFDETIVKVLPNITADTRSSLIELLTLGKLAPAKQKVEFNSTTRDYPKRVTALVTNINTSLRVKEDVIDSDVVSKVTTILTNIGLDKLTALEQINFVEGFVKSIKDNAYTITNNIYNIISRGEILKLYGKELAKTDLNTNTKVKKNEPIKTKKSNKLMEDFKEDEYAGYTDMY